ncbi:MAG: precorrin-6Y C5,15-methyltransferase (decarboxylating) subunit CbiT [Firmicutes bacterium]|nr:precorrin-6Y C5,15-methyltransferase (decarboxylating) subunit CbiT [Bacillota bacterium]
MFKYIGFGLPDDAFIRGPVPMTKREIRILALAALKLQPGQIIWDVGAGTGSLSVEAALSVPAGQVFAVERNGAAVALLQQNKEHFALENMVIVPGEAPEVLAGLPDPQRIIIGGSGGKLAEILHCCQERLTAGGIIVINVVTIENLSLALKFLNHRPFVEREGLYMQTARLEQLGSQDFFRAQNGVWILSARKEG